MCRTSATQSTGFSLIEIMVALVVLAIGLLGVATLQFQSLRSNNDASQRSSAIWLAQELAERMHANPQGVADNDYLAAIDCEAAPAAICADSYDYEESSAVNADDCTPAQLAAHDLWELQCGPAIDAGDVKVTTKALDFLYGGNIDVACADADTVDADPCSVGSVYTVTVSWRDKAGVADSVSVKVYP